jgi:hypothetical protein
MNHLRRHLLRGRALLTGAVIAAAGTFATAQEALASTCCASSGAMCHQQVTCTRDGCVYEYYYYGQPEQM